MPLYAAPPLAHDWTQVGTAPYGPIYRCSRGCTTDPEDDPDTPCHDPEED